MTATTAPPGDPPALRRLEELEQRFPRHFTPEGGIPRRRATTTARAPSPAHQREPAVVAEQRPVSTAVPGMGYQPGLDGIRALSVLAVIGYHAGISWLPGGFFGVEVFFVVSGFLITSLLLEERASTGGVSLRHFWLRRARRLLPALAAMLAAVAVWAVFAGSAEQLAQLRRDLPWSIFYVGNWGQILGDVPYYAGEPPLLRHVWSLAVEEQWYLLWPLAFVALASAWSRARCAKVVAGAAVASMLLTAWLSFGEGPLRSPIGLFDGIDRVNFAYLSTPTRASGLLLGAAAAFVWRPWRRARTVSAAGARVLDRVGVLALVALALAVVFGHLQEPYVYRWLLPLVTVASLALTAIVVVPGHGRLRAAMSWRPLVEVGKRSYGLYLWHWPIFVITDATEGSLLRLVRALVLTAVVSELCFRFVETPVRRGALGRWWRRTDRRRMLATVGAPCFMVVALVAYYADVRPYDAASGGATETFELAEGDGGRAAPPASAATAEVAPGETSPAPAVDPAAGSAGPTAPPSTVAAPPELPVSLSIVGDSQAHSLAINLPDGIESTFSVSDASLDGCSVYDRGGVVSTRDFDNDFGICAGWQERWASAGASSDVVLVVLGAWDVFDLEVDGTVLPFASSEWDAAFTDAVQQGIDAIASGGARAALLEVPCMRPIDVDGAGVPALPERGDDGRVAHVNELLRGLAADNPDTAAFVEGPDQFCTGPEATDIAYRWDGVHVYVPGADLVYEKIAPSLLSLA